MIASRITSMWIRYTKNPFWLLSPKMSSPKFHSKMVTINYLQILAESLSKTWTGPKLAQIKVCPFLVRWYKFNYQLYSVFFLFRNYFLNYFSLRPIRKASPNSVGLWTKLWNLWTRATTVKSQISWRCDLETRPRCWWYLAHFSIGTLLKGKLFRFLTTFSKNNQFDI